MAWGSRRASLERVVSRISPPVSSGAARLGSFVSRGIVRCAEVTHATAGGGARLRPKVLVVDDDPSVAPATYSWRALACGTCTSRSSSELHALLRSRAPTALGSATG